MWKIIMAVLLVAVAMLAAPPLPSKVFTLGKESIVVGIEAPSDSQLFSDEKEVLASIKVVES